MTYNDIHNALVNFLQEFKKEIKKEHDYITNHITKINNAKASGNKLSNEEANLVLSGNTLGGEVNLPLLSKKYDGSTTYYKDYYENNNMYISNGIGTRTYHLRLFNKPSISLFRFKSTGEK